VTVPELNTAAWVQPFLMSQAAELCFCAGSWIEWDVLGVGDGASLVAPCKDVQSW